MSSRIEHDVAVKAVKGPPGRGAAWRRVARRSWWAAMFASFVATNACSDGGRELIATIRIEAGAPDVAKCETTDFHDAADMGLDLYFVLERSRDNDYEWDHVMVALGALFNSTAPAFEGMGVGFAIYPKRMPPPLSCIDNCGMFPECDCLEDCGCWDEYRPNPDTCICSQWRTSCDPNDYTSGLEISRVNENSEGFSYLALLRASRNPITSADQPAMYPALLASLRDRDVWEERNPQRPIIQVLVATSFEFPSHLECESDDDVSDVEEVLSGAKKPKTYVVAVNANLNDARWDDLAAAGRTDPAKRIFLRGQRPEPSATELFAEVIRKIRDADGRCEYLLPVREAPIDDKKVNLTASSGGLLYPKVANRAACAGNNQGWYYDTDDNPTMNPALPRRIMACDGACRSLHGPDVASGSGTARIQIGCPTVMAGDAGTPRPR